MRRGKWTAVGAMVASVAMITAACGSGSGSSNAGSSGSAAPAGSSAEPSSGGSSGGSSGSSTPEGSSSSEAPAGSSGSSAPESSSGGSATGSSAGSGGGSATASGKAFQFGYVLPQTGDLAYLGPPQIQAVKYALSLINKAGGINGQKAPDAIAGDEANDAALAQKAATDEINKGVNAIIGAAATGMTMAIIDSVTKAGVAECSGSNTGVVLTDYPKKIGPKGNQMYFRTAPSDALQGPVLGQMILKAGYSNIAIVYRNDDYGKGLANSTAKAIESGGGKVVMKDGYDIKTPDFSGLVSKIQSKSPDAIVTVSFDEGWQLWKALINAGINPSNTGVYGADGMRSTDAPKKTFGSNAGKIDGWGGTAPASVDNPDFIKNLKAFAPKLQETQFAPQVFDCVNIFALAADQAGSNDPADWTKKVNGITQDGGQKCTNYADCLKIIKAGDQPHYVGASGDLNFTKHGEPGKAQIEEYKYDNGGKLTTVGTETSQF